MIGYADKHGSLEHNTKLVNKRNKNIIKYIKSLMTSNGKNIHIETTNTSNTNPIYVSDESNRLVKIMVIR